MKGCMWAMRIVGIVMLLIAMYLLARMQKMRAELNDAPASAPAR